MNELKHFRIWVQNVLPVVYDDSLSYYEVLCKCVDYINNLIDTDRELFTDIDGVKQDIRKVEEWIANFNTNYAEEIIRNSIATMIFVEITDEGYFVYHIPSNWNNIVFNTTGVDIELEQQPEYGHLVLSY